MFGSMIMTTGAIGLIETKGFLCAIEAANTMIKTEGIELAGKESIGEGYTTLVICGELGAVKSAIDAGAAAASKIGEVASAYVIGRPHPELNMILPGRK
jgi:ethanolamine utilization protein EutM